VVFVAYDPFISGLVGLFLARVTGGRVVCEVNGTYGAVENFVSAGAVGMRKQRIMLTLGSWVLRRVDGVKLLYAGQLRGFGLEEDRLNRWVFFDSVDSARFAAETEVEQEKVLLFVGYPFALKGVDVLLRAFGSLADDFPGWKLVLVGFDLERQAELHGVVVPESVVFTGAVAPEVVAEWMDRCSVIVLPSLSEGLPRVLLEAGLKGRARVATRVGGVPDLIRDGVDGVLVDPGDEGGLREAIRELMASAEVRNRVAAEAREASRRAFTEDVYLDHYTDVIETIGSVRT
jgi:glycosyltransferase involved in cell wall biosynthesis